MAISNKDIETLWGRYQTEGVNKIGFVSPAIDDRFLINNY